MSRLLDESWIEGLPDAVVENLEELNRYVVNRVCERIRKIGDIGAADAHRLKSVMEYAAGDMQAIEKEIARIMQKNVRDIDAIFEKAAAENIDFANAFFAARGTAPLKSYAQIAALDSLVRAVKAQAMDGLTNISNTHMIGFKDKTGFKPLRESYIRAIDRAIYFVQTGAVDYNTAIRETVRDMARSGLRVTFESGYSRRLDSQARMNILEGVRRLNGEMMRETGRRFGADGVEISAHALCAPDHLDIQGRQYRQAEWDRKNGGLQRPIGTLNCHHFATPIIYGVSRPVYSEKELAEINRRSTEKVEWKGREMTRYEASQQQRRMETKIRYAKDEREALKAAGDTIGARQAGKKSAALQREYKAFCEKTGLTPRYERTRSMTGSTVAKAAGAKSAGGLASSGKSGIMKKNGMVGGALTPNSQRAIRHAEQYYEAVRKMTTDAKRIAENTGYSVEAIQAIKSFIFLELHDLGDGRFDRFDASFEMAESWQRLIDGKQIQPHDLTLLKHEIMERELMLQGLTQEEAHILTSQKYNYAKEAYEFYNG